MMPSTYIGRFAPSPSGPLHAGSLVAALASWLDARAWNRGPSSWLVRIEDLDTARCVPGASSVILEQLAAFSLRPDEPPLFQSSRTKVYEQALEQLHVRGLVYPCACSRKDIEEELARRGQPRPRHGELVYPGTCRNGVGGKPALAWRFRTDLAQARRPGDASGSGAVVWIDRRLGPQRQDVVHTVGDFVLRRADGPFAYQLAVVVDDAAQQVTHIVRGEDLADNTARQLLLQSALGFSTPTYLHTPLVRGANGEKLSKQNGAQALDTFDPLITLHSAAEQLGLPSHAGGVADALACWVAAWRALYNPSL